MRWVFAMVLVLVCTAAGAQFIGLLHNSPAELFDDMDLRLFLDTSRRVLDEGAENQVVAWNNPANGHGGDMTVLKRFESKGRPCQLLRVRNQAQGRKSDMRHNLCMVDGRWRLVGDLKPGEKK
jgi:surface antigen